MNDLLEQDIEAIGDLRTMQESLDRLLEKLPSRFYPPELREYHAQLSQWSNEGDQLESQIERCDNMQIPDARCSMESIEEMDRRSDQLGVHLMMQRIDLSKLSEPVLTYAKQELKRREDRYTFANIGSVVFFTAGWLLSLIGTVYRVPGVTIKSE